MSTTTAYEEVLAQALKLAPKERLQLIERIASSVEHDIEAAAATQEPPHQHWGQSLVQLINSLDLSEWEAMEMDDPVEWVKSIRKESDVS